MRKSRAGENSKFPPKGESEKRDMRDYGDDDLFRAWPSFEHVMCGYDFEFLTCNHVGIDSKNPFH